MHTEKVIYRSQYDTEICSVLNFRYIGAVSSKIYPLRISSLKDNKVFTATVQFFKHLQIYEL